MDFNTLLQTRRSVRSFDPDKKVTKEQIEELIRAASMAPTWKNTQTGRYYAVCSDEAIDAFRNDCLPGFNQKSSTNAALIVATYVKDLSGFTKGVPDNELGNQWGAYDLGCQNTYLVLKAADMGLDTLIMGIRDSEAIRRQLSVPKEEEIVAVIAVGYRTGEPVFRERKTTEEILRFF